MEQGQKQVIGSQKRPQDGASQSPFSVGTDQQFRGVVEKAGEGILITAGGRALYANPKCCELVGVTEEEFKTRPFTDFIHPDDREMVLSKHVRRLRGEVVDNNYVFRILQDGGKVIWVNISAVLFEWEGQPATLNFLADVSLRIQAEEDVRQALQRERELSELKSRFVAVASHEFRTPLAAILTSVELLDVYADRLGDSERHEIVSDVKLAAHRMEVMVEQVLLTSRLEAGVFSFHPEATNVELWLSEALKELRHANSQASRIRLDIRVVPCCRQLDVQLASHVLMNLLTNALKYSDETQPVLCTVSCQEDALVIAVRDRGIGIPAADRDRLFETFHRASNVGGVPGTGIGLFIVAECARLHGGGVRVESVVGDGSTFTATLHAPAA